MIRSTADLARALGLSRWTVSRALNGHADIAAETRERVLAEAGRLGFAPSLIGKSLRSGVTDWIGVTLPDLEDFYLTAKVSRLQERLAGEGWRALMQVGDGGERQAFERFAAMRCAGVIAVAARASDEDLAPLRRAGIPLVAIDPLGSLRTDEVLTDRAQAMRTMVRHFHARGHRAVMAAGLDVVAGAYARQRRRGLLGAARSCGWAEDAVKAVPSPGPNNMEAGVGLAKRYLLESPAQRASAVIAINDRVAFGFLRELVSAGVRVPEDVAVSGYDNSELAAFCAPPLTTVDARSDDLIDAAVDLLLRRIRGGEEVTPERVVIRPRLVLRETA